MLCENLMDVANIVIALLALLVAVGAIFISTRQAKKSDNIALIGLRIDFYNHLCETIRRYEILVEFKMMMNAKNSDLIFSQGQKSNLVAVVLSNVGDGDVVRGLQQITKDLNFLDINKYLFNQEIIGKINDILNLLSKFQKIATECLTGKNTEDEFQVVLESLRNILKKAETDLMNKIKKVILTDNKIKHSKKS